MGENAQENSSMGPVWQTVDHIQSQILVNKEDLKSEIFFVSQPVNGTEIFQCSDVLIKGQSDDYGKEVSGEEVKGTSDENIDEDADEICQMTFSDDESMTEQNDEGVKCEKCDKIFKGGVYVVHALNHGNVTLKKPVVDMVFLPKFETRENINQ